MALPQSAFSEQHRWAADADSVAHGQHIPKAAGTSAAHTNSATVRISIVLARFRINSRLRECKRVANLQAQENKSSLHAELATLCAKCPRQAQRWNGSVANWLDRGNLELVQWDTSEHDWLEGRGPARYLVRMIDDATSWSWGRFVERDATPHNTSMRKRACAVRACGWNCAWMAS